MNVLLADDHPMCLDGYITALNDPNHTYSLAYSCEDVYRLSLKHVNPDIAVLDHNMKPFEERNLNSGVDCAKYIRRLFPGCRIIIITAHAESMVLYNIYEQLSPDALIIKSDFTTNIFKKLVFDNTSGLAYLSPTAQKAINTIKGTLLDSKNREILMYLSNGFKIIQLQDFVSLSTSGIQKRIIKMLQEFNVSDYQELVVLAKKEGFL